MQKFDKLTGKFKGPANALSADTELTSTLSIHGCVTTGHPLLDWLF